MDSQATVRSFARSGLNLETVRSEHLPESIWASIPAGDIEALAAETESARATEPIGQRTPRPRLRRVPGRPVAVRTLTAVRSYGVLRISRSATVLVVKRRETSRTAPDEGSAERGSGWYTPLHADIAQR